jgi:peptidoglycan hydrolase-like protein with peptidoglycan-binding domain
VRNKGRTERAAAAVIERPRILQNFGWSNRDAVGVLVALSAGIMILVNTLFLQPGPHPAPMVRSSVAAITPPRPASGSKSNPSLAGTGSVQKQAHPNQPAAPKTEHVSAAPSPAPTARPTQALITEIQRELHRRGFYDGVVDGRYGPRTDAAIRDFEHAAGLRPSSEPNDALLRSIQRSPVRSRPTVQRPPVPVPDARPDPIAELIAPSNQVIAVQRALSEFGYGQIKPTGVVDPQTQSAIQKFERERRLPVTGQLSHRVVRELASITGRPLE